MTPSTFVQAYNRIIALHFPSSAEWSLHAHKENYKIIAIDGCALVFGRSPPSAMRKLSKLVPKKSVVDSYVARLAGANLAAGMPKDLKLLAERLKPEAIKRLREELGDTNLSDAALTWLAVGERGASSEAMFYRLTGVLPPTWKNATLHVTLMTWQILPAVANSLNRSRNWLSGLHRWRRYHQYGAA